MTRTGAAHILSWCRNPKCRALFSRHVSGYSYYCSRDCYIFVLKKKKKDYLKTLRRSDSRRDTLIEIEF